MVRTPKNDPEDILLFPNAITSGVYSLPPQAQSAEVAALATLPTSEEPLSPEQEAELARARDDLASGRVYSHEHVKRLFSTSWMQPRARRRSGAELAILWTLTADMQRLALRDLESAIMTALDEFAVTCRGAVCASGHEREYVLSAREWRVQFSITKDRLYVLGVFAR